MSNIIIIRSSGAIETMPAETVELETLQEIVGGYIETMPTAIVSDLILIINEEGKLHDLPLNPVATSISRLCSDYIVGDAALVKADGEDLVGLTDEEVRIITPFLCLLGGKTV